MLYRWDNHGFSIPVVFRSKALRVSLSTPSDCVAPLYKGMAKAGLTREASALGLACEARLAVNVDKLTELAIIPSIEH